MKILLTGANGFIGQHMHRALSEACWMTSLLSTGPRACQNIQELDVTDPDQVKSVLRHFLPDMIIHLAGKASVKLPQDDPKGERLWATNVDGTRNLLDWAPKGCRFVLASSATVYGKYEHHSKPFTEDAAVNPSSLYAASKVAAEALVRAATRLEKVNGLSLRYVANVGAGATHGVLRDLYHKAKTAEEFLPVLGSYPGSWKPYCHVEDTVRATLFLAQNMDLQGAFNIAPDTLVSTLWIANEIMRQINRPLPISWRDENWPGDDNVVYLCNKKLQGTGFQFTYPNSFQAVSQGIKDFVCQDQKEEF